MERGGAFHGYQRFQKPNSGMMSVELNTPHNQTQNQNQNQTQYGGGGELDSNPDRDGACTVREQDRFMPIANVIRIMRKVLPTHAKISDDAKETIQECVSEYISFITSEANDKCQREQRKTITAEDVLWAMSKLGFDDYIEPLTAYLHRYRELEGDHRGSLRGEPLPKRAVEVGPVAAMAYGPAAFHMGLHHQGLFGGGMGAYFRDGSGVNPSQAAMAGYDPFAAYK